jgi:PEGA domain
MPRSAPQGSTGAPPATYDAPMLMRDGAAALAAAVLLGILSGCGGAPSQPVAKADLPPSEAAEATEADETSGTLDVLSADPMPVLLDGKPIGKTPISQRPVAAGSHEVTFVDEENGNRTMVVSVQPGEATTVKADSPPKKVKMLVDTEPTEGSESQ